VTTLLLPSQLFENVRHPLLRMNKIQLNHEVGARSSCSDVFPDDPRLRFSLESRSSFENREPVTSGHISRRCNEARVRGDAPISIESPPKSQPEIRVPTGASNVTSRTLTHAVGTFSTK
jgi:hypothetical protein